MEEKIYENVYLKLDLNGGIKLERNQPY